MWGPLGYVVGPKAHHGVVWYVVSLQFVWEKGGGVSSRGVLLYGRDYCLGHSVIDKR